MNQNVANCQQRFRSNQHDPHPQKTNNYLNATNIAPAVIREREFTQQAHFNDCSTNDATADSAQCFIQPAFHQPNFNQINYPSATFNYTGPSNGIANNFSGPVACSGPTNFAGPTRFSSANFNSQFWQSGVPGHFDGGAHSIRSLPAIYNDVSSGQDYFDNHPDCAQHSLEVNKERMNYSR